MLDLDFLELFRLKFLSWSTFVDLSTLLNHWLLHLFVIVARLFVSRGLLLDLLYLLLRSTDKMLLLLLLGLMRGISYGHGLVIVATLVGDLTAPTTNDEVFFFLFTVATLLSRLW